jgi:hypothetical protein
MKAEATVIEYGDHHRNRQTLLHLLRLGVERLAELHDIDTMLTQRRTHRRARVGLTGRHLQLDVPAYFLGHLDLSPRVQAPGHCQTIGSPFGFGMHLDIRLQCALCQDVFLSIPSAGFEIDRSRLMEIPDRAIARPGSKNCNAQALQFFDLRKVQLHGRGSTKDRYRHA